MARVTIKDIAKEVGVSHPTVSKALADLPGININTKRRIMEAAERMNYVPNVAAQRLAKRKSRSIGFVWNNSENLFLYHLCTKIQKKAEENNIDLLITMSEDSRSINNLYNHCVDFIFCWNSGELDISPKRLKELRKSGCGFMFLGGNKNGFSDNLIIDREQGVRNVVNYFIENGHRRIAFFGIESEKKTGFINSIREFGLASEQNPVVMIESSYYKNFKEYENELYEKFSVLKNSEYPPTALFLDSQNLTMGFLNVFKKLNISVPEDLSLITYDDIPEFRMYPVELTTLSPSLDEISSIIINRFEEYYNDKAGENINIHIIPEIIKRESVKCLKREEIKL